MRDTDRTFPVFDDCANYTAFELIYLTILRMKYALVLTGALAGLALAVPDLVLLGYVFLILPGLILTIAPTLFVYLAATAIIRRLLPIASPVPRTATAFAISLLIGWALMQPFRLSAIAAFQEAELADVLPSQAIQIHGHVLLERLNQRIEPECDYLCLAVLDSPGVKSVTTVTAGRGKPQNIPPSNAYSLVSAKTDPTVSLFPSEPGEIVRKYQSLVNTNLGKDFNTAVKSVEAKWAIRLAGPERLRTVSPVQPELADWIIRIETPSNRRTSTLRRITILDAHGTTHFRQTYRKQAVPAGMFYMGYHASLSGGTASAHFHVGHQILEEGKSTLDLESALLQAIACPVPDYPADSVNLLRDQVVQALDAPTARPTQLELARRYLGLFYFDAKAQDEILIARIVADHRIKDIDEQLKNVFSKNKTPATVRDSFINRIGMSHSSASLRQHLAECLANMPPGTFAEPNPNYHAIWNSPEICQQAAPMIVTLADLGSDRAIPILERLLGHAVGLPNWQERRSMIEGIRSALVRLGPSASSLVPQICELFLRRPSPILNNYGDANQWRFALARMGVAIEDLPVFPTQSTQSVEKERQRVADQLRRYDRNTAEVISAEVR